MPKTNNLTGFQEDRYYTWRCRCDCGKEIIVNTKRLVRGTITNCGCVPKGNAKNAPIAEDLTNQKFGKFVVLKRMPNQNDRRKWLCQCNCGNTCIVLAHELKAGKTQSCGCHRAYVLRERKTDLSGKKFGRLTPLYSTEKREKKDLYTGTANVIAVQNWILQKIVWYTAIMLAVDVANMKFNWHSQSS